MKEKTVIFLIFMIFSITYTWPLVLNLPNTVINSGDPLFYAWNLSHNFSSLFLGTEAIINTNIFYPTTNTLAFSDTLFTQSILTSPLLFLTNNPILVQNIYTLLSFALAGFGVYALSRVLNLSPIASLLAGVFFAFSYPRLGQMSHISIASSFLLPFFFLQIIKFFSKATILNAVLLVLVFLLLLGSTIYLGIIAALGAGVFICVLIVKNKDYRKILRDKKMLVILSLLSTLVLSLGLLYPYVILRIEHPEIIRSYDEISARGAYQKDLISILPSSLFLSKIFPYAEGERSLYPTFSLLILGLLGLFSLRKSKNLILAALFATGISGIILSFGPARPFVFGPLDTGYITLPYAFLLRIFPILYILRVPSRFIILFTLMLSIYSGIGFDVYKKKYRLALFFLVILFFVETAQKPLSLISISTGTDLPPVYKAIKTDPTIHTIIELPIIEERDKAGQLAIQEQVKMQYADVSIHTPLVLETYRTYFSLFHKKQMINGYSGYVPESFHNAVEEMKYFPEERAISFLKRKKITHVILHLWQYDINEKNLLLEKLSEGIPDAEFATYGEDRIYAVSSF